MLEAILRIKDVEKDPYLTFIWALMITTVGILFSSQLSYKITLSEVSFNLSGLFAVIFTIIPAVFFINNFINHEEEMEEEELSKHRKGNFWDRHLKDMIILGSFFFGVMFAFAIWAFIMPQDFFQVQLAKVMEIRGEATGQAIQGMAIPKGSLESFVAIAMNNTEVFLFAFVFALLFGAGAIFIIVWNASVLGAYIGSLSKELIHIPVVTLSFLPHGILEIGGYLMAGLAGGIISAAMIRERDSEILTKIMFDSLQLLIVGMVLILAGAFVEVYI